MHKKILMILTSHDQLGNTGEKTGFWVEEFAAPYYEFIDADVEVTIASPKGGQPPIDPKSELADFQTPSTLRFDTDKEVQNKLANSMILAELNANDYDAVFYPGGHGPLWDLVNNEQSISIIETTLAANKPVAAVCHASAVLLNAKTQQGDAIVKGKAITGFTNTEEAAVQLTDVVPFLLEDSLKEHGAEFSSAADWHEFVIQDGLLITGQNPASSALAAKKLVAHLTK